MPRLKKHKLVDVELQGTESIGERLARIRKEHGLTQKKLAEKIGVTRSVIMDFERDKNHLYDQVIIRIALVLGISSDELLGIKNSKKKVYPSSLRIIKRMKRIEELPTIKQKKILENIDIILRGFENS